VAAASTDPATRAAAEAGFREVHRLGVDGYPTLLHTATGTHRLGGPVSSAQVLWRGADSDTSRASAQRPAEKPRRVAVTGSNRRAFAGERSRYEPSRRAARSSAETSTALPCLEPISMARDRR
jgi:hypothetical protein